MNYARIENGQVTQTSLPTTGILTQIGFEGCQTSSYNLLPYESSDPSIPSLKNEGWLPLTDNMPAYNSETEYLEHTGYTIGETEVLADYIVKQIAHTVAVPTTADRLAAIEEALLMLI